VRLICDACRTVPGGRVGAIEWPAEKWSYFDGYSRGRALFDEFIAQSDFGREIVHATVHGTPAFDSGKGGEFTSALMETVINRQKNGLYGPLMLPDAVQLAKYAMMQAGKDQIPEIVYRVGDLHVPFSIAHPDFIIRSEMKPQLKQALEAENALLALVGVGLGLYMLSRL